MSLEQKIDKLIENVVLLTGKVEQRAKVNEHSNAQASQSITQAGKTVSNATHDIQRITSQTVGSAILKPVDELDHSLKNMRDELIGTADNVEKKMQESVGELKRIIWTATGAFALAGVVVAGASIYAFSQANQKIKQADWVSSINAAVASGKLTTCPDGGICASVDKKLIRLDK